MKFSVNNLNYYRDLYQWSADITANGVDALTQRIGAQLGAIEEVTPYGAQFTGAVIARVVACQDHPNADRLHVCMIDDGGTVEEVERTKDGLVQVVCGAPNVREGLTVVWLPPGATVPESVGKDPFVLGARELRGVVSNGMLASPRELTIGDNHDGILEVDGTIKPGTSFIDAFHLQDDVIIDIENKMFTHRPDCFGFMGVARELAGIQGVAFTSPEWYVVDPQIPHAQTDELPLQVTIDAAEIVPRFTAIAMRDVHIAPSPVWLQVELAKVGLRPINNVVDYTNYLMLITGQPLHAYDYDKVLRVQPSGNDAVRLGARMAKPQEQLALLNGKTVELQPTDIVITGGDVPIGLGGVMGGGNTQVDNDTKNIIIEVATFDMYAIRRTSMHHGIFSDAVTRYNKGQSPLQNLAVLLRMVHEVQEHMGGKVAGPAYDVQTESTTQRIARKSMHAPVTVSAAFINQRLGLQLSPAQIQTILHNVECIVSVEDDQLTVTAPFWRTDIEIPEDVVEEVGRLYGYDNLPLDLPLRSLKPAVRNQLLDLKQRLRSALAKSGASEVLTYSFVHGNLLAKVGQETDKAFQISNALSPDLQFYRLSLTPSLLEKVHPNIKAGYTAFALFELGKAHHVALTNDEGLPAEFERLALVYAADDKLSRQKTSGAPYYQAKQLLDAVLVAVGAAGRLEYKPLDQVDVSEHNLVLQMIRPFEPRRAAVVWDGEQVVGVVGEYRADVRRALKLPAYSAGFEVFQRVFAQQQMGYAPLSRFPKVTQDVCLKVGAELSYASVYEFVDRQLANIVAGDMLFTLEPVDIYQRSDTRAHKQITLRITVASYKRTLTDAEVSKMLDAVADAAAAQLQAERV